MQPATLVLTNLEGNAELTASGGERAAGIGGVRRGYVGTINILGGDITATGGNFGGAGIGSGFYGTSADINIYGGRIWAYGGKDGSGMDGDTSYRAAGIGGGDTSKSIDCRINIAGGTVVAGAGDYDNTTATKYAADIGDGYSGEGGGYTVAISGGSVKPLSKKDAATSHKAFNQSKTAEGDRIVPKDGDNSQVYEVELAGFTPNEKLAVELSNYGTNDIYADADGNIYVWIPNGVYNCRAGTKKFAIKMESGSCTTVAIPDAYGVELDGVDIADLFGADWAYNPFDRTLSVTNDCVLAGTNTESKINIIAAPTDEMNLVISNLYLKTSGAMLAIFGKPSPIAVTSGTVNVCLAGTNTLDASETSYYAALNVAAGATLVLTNLEENATLFAYGGTYAAAIGGNNETDAGKIHICGGYITANGGVEGAGIGGGDEAAVQEIAISGGVITATSSSDGAGIGGGSKGNTGKIEISGGFITARGGDEYGGAGIGSGYKGKSGNIYISGGNIQAYGGKRGSGSLFASTYRGAGIGGGSDSDSRTCTIAISGGTVVAGAGDYTNTSIEKYAADIGDGYDGEDGYRIVITGGSVKPLGVSARQFNESEYSVWNYPVDGDNNAVYRVLRYGFTPSAKTDFEMVGYGSSDIYADEDGNIHLWLANNTTSQYRTGGKRYAIKVTLNGWKVEIVELPDAYGVKVDDVDVTELSGSVWEYNPFTNILSLSGDCVVSGTNSVTNITVSASTDVTVSPSRLVLDAGEGANILAGAGTVTITNGTAYLKGNATCPVKILGGSVHFDGTAAIAFSNDTVAVQSVVIEELSHDAAVAFTGLPEYYGTSAIYADAAGKAYLWLPETWDTPITLKTMSGKVFKLLKAPVPSTTHKFIANGYNYSVTIDANEGGAVAERGEKLELNSLRIDDFTVADGELRIGITASPATWLYGFIDTLKIRASATLPIPDTDDANLDLTDADLQLVDAETATFIVPLGDKADCRFFRMVEKEAQ